MARRGSVTIRESGVTLRGADELDRRLMALQGSVLRGPILERGLRAGAEALREGMASRSPSSTIAANLVTEYTPGDTRTAVAKVGPARVDVRIGGRKVFLQALAYWFEFGTRAHVIVARAFRRGRRGRRMGAVRALFTPLGFFKSVRHPGMTAQPFMRPTIDEDGEKALRRAQGAVWDEIQRAAGRR